MRGLGWILGTAEQFVWENEREFDERCVDYDYAASSLITITTTTIASTGAASVAISSGVVPDELVSSRILSLTTRRILSKFPSPAVVVSGQREVVLCHYSPIL
ncbi:hypothetical protein R3P38DRAFT_3251829, partial [Favolaschia claudopus]